jgi:protein SCO1/2
MAQLDFGDNWQLLTITLDPENDTPSVLAALAGNEGADARHWSFARAKVETVRHLGRTIGLEFTVTAEGQISHNLRTVVIDPAGRITHIFKGNAWTPQELAAEMHAAMQLRH